MMLGGTRGGFGSSNVGEPTARTTVSEKKAQEDLPDSPEPSTNPDPPHAVSAIPSPRRSGEAMEWEKRRRGADRGRRRREAMKEEVKSRRERRGKKQQSTVFDGSEA